MRRPSKKIIRFYISDKASYIRFCCAVSIAFAVTLMVPKIALANEDILDLDAEVELNLNRSTALHQFVTTMLRLKVGMIQPNLFRFL